MTKIIIKKYIIVTKNLKYIKKNIRNIPYKSGTIIKNNYGISYLFFLFLK